jgi:hypothetical protein
LATGDEVAAQVVNDGGAPMTFIYGEMVDEMRHVVANLWAWSMRSVASWSDEEGWPDVRWRQ